MPATVSCKFATATAPLASVAVTVNGHVPTASPPLAVAAATVPESSPARDSASPGGSEPDVTAHRYGPAPPVADSAAE